MEVEVGLDWFVHLKDVFYNYIAQERFMQNLMGNNRKMFFYNLDMEIILCIYTTYYTVGKSLKLPYMSFQVIDWICSSGKAV